MGLPRRRAQRCRTTSAGSACTSTRGSPSARCTRAARSCAALDDLRARGVVVRAGRRHVAARHRLRRPARPGAGEVRRLHHLPLQRHRVPPRQVRPRVGAPHRHLGCRPPRAGEVAAGGDGGARVPRRRARGAARSAGEADEGRRAGPHLEAHRQRDRARRHPRRGRSRRRPAHVPAAGHRHRRRPSTSTSSPRSRWRTPSTTCSTRTPASRRSAGGRRGGHHAPPGARDVARAAGPRARARPAARARGVPRRARGSGRAAGAASRHHVGARLRQGVPRLLPRLPGDLRRRGAHAGPPLAGRSVPARPGRRARHPRRARPRRDVAPRRRRPT